MTSPSATILSTDEYNPPTLVPVADFRTRGTRATNSRVETLLAWPPIGPSAAFHWSTRWRRSTSWGPSFSPRYRAHSPPRRYQFSAPWPARVVMRYCVATLGQAAAMVAQAWRVAGARFS